MKYTSSLLFLILFITPQFLLAQEINNDLKKIRTAYDSKEDWHIHIDAKAWDLERNEKPSHSYSATIKKRGDEMMIDMEDVQVVANNKYMLSYQKSNKVIVCQKHNPAFVKQQQAIPDITDLLDKEGQDIIYKGIIDGLHFYTIKNGDDQASLIELYFQQETYLVEKMVYHFKENNSEDISKLEMTMKYMDTKKAFSDFTFSEKQFVYIDAQFKVSLLKKYKDYHLVLGQGLTYSDEIN